MDNDLIREGFICPECREDLTSFDLLQAHFELKHSQSSIVVNNYDKIGNSSITSVFSKAKTLLLSSNNEQNQSNEQFNNQQSQQSVATASNTIEPVIQYNLPPQENGVFRSHTNEFKAHRDNTVGRHVIQTNKLLITLDKLISNDTIKDENKRKAFEMSLVTWIPDDLVHLCPTCARSFGLLQRKHHCRLCGAIMCNKCSQFLSFIAAKQLTDPTMFMRDNELKFKRSNSNTSINSHQIQLNDEPQSSNEQYLRLCINCSKLLNKKYQLMKDKANKPKIFDLYDEFYSCIKDSQKLYPAFDKMSESLRAGETVHSLKNAEDMRAKLLLLFQKVDLLSNKILNYGVQKEQNGVITTNISKDQLKMQKNIRLYAINYLKEYSFQLATLPSKEEYEKLVEKKKKLLLEELQRESLEKLKLLELNMATKKPQQEQKLQQKSKQKNDKTHINNADGWIATTDGNNLQNEHDDPIKLQIKLVESYLEEARKQNRHEEIDILENNLKELKAIVNVQVNAGSNRLDEYYDDSDDI